MITSNSKRSAPSRKRRRFSKTQRNPSTAFGICPGQDRVAIRPRFGGGEPEGGGKPLRGGAGRRARPAGDAAPAARANTKSRSRSSKTPRFAPRSTAPFKLARPIPASTLAIGTPICRWSKPIRCACGWRCPSGNRFWSRPGSESGFGFEGSTNKYTGRIARLSPALTEADRMLQVEADVPNETVAGGLVCAGGGHRQRTEHALTVPRPGPGDVRGHGKGRGGRGRQGGGRKS